MILSRFQTFAAGRNSIFASYLRPIRHLPSPACTVPIRRSGTIGERKGGFLKLGSNEGLICFTNLLPTQRTRFLASFCHGLTGYNICEIVENNCIPQSLKDSASPEKQLTIIKTIPRPKDGAVFVQYGPKSNEEMIESTIAQHLKINPVRRWFRARRVKAFAVRGDPWLEEMRRFPTKTLRVEFTGGEGYLSEQALYVLFRRYGKITDINAPKPTDIEKVAIIKFLRVDGASAAKNCLDGHTVEEMEAVYGKEEGVRLRIWYKSTRQLGFISDLIRNHPRYMIPVLLIIAGTIIVNIFDPIRSFSVEARLTGFPKVWTRNALKSITESFTNRYRTDICAIMGNPQYLEYLMRSAQNEEDAEKDSPRQSKTDKEEEKLEKFLKEEVASRIAILGHPNGKRKELVYKVLSNMETKHILYIDCKPIAAALDESAVIKEFAAQIGYRPVFSTITWIVDLLALFGNNSAGRFQKPFEAQINEILHTVETVLKNVALRDKQKNEKDSDVSEAEYLYKNPTRRPVVVIDNFMPQEGLIYKKLEERALQLATESHARIIFLTQDHGFAKTPGGRFIIVNDTSDDKTKTSPSAERLYSEILRKFLLPNSRPRKASAHDQSWTPSQAWYLIRGLASGDLPYDTTMLDPLFQVPGGELAIRELEQHGMISIAELNARPAKIRPGPRGHQETFRELLKDKALGARMEVQSMKTLIERDGKKIEKAEAELVKLETMGKKPAGRVGYLLKKAGEAQARIEQYEKRMKEQEEVLKTQVEEGEDMAKGGRWQWSPV
ncbi:RNA12 protein-domain-containing protein [Geopyxis carbonaria]|nr:RNA12 protein-domain-containing protein [Geopyxis carbonaria]